MCLRSSDRSKRFKSNDGKSFGKIGKVVEVFITAEEFVCCQMNNGGP